MKKWLFPLAIFCSCLLFGLPIQDRKINPFALAELTTRLNIPPGTDLILETQKQWLRKPGQERWEIEELSPSQKLYVLDWATNQGLFEAWKPLYQSYDKALILGTTTSRMQMRLDFLKALWNEGIRFQEIVWLTGDRPLDNRVDNLTDRCKNESEAAHILWEETELPAEMRICPVTFIAVPMKQEGSSLKRPNTEDTILAWLQNSPNPCRALFVSNQPFCGYQFAVIKATLPEQYEFDLVGQSFDSTSHPSAAAITLDSMARWIYQEHQIAKAQ
jgi:hypothetical protein